MAHTDPFKHNPFPIDFFDDLIWNHLPMCGCGEPEEVLFRLYAVLEWWAMPHLERNRDALEALTGGRWASDLLMNSWDRAESSMRRDGVIGERDYISEHGSSHYGGWLSSLGDRILSSFREYGFDPDVIDRLREEALRDTR